MNKQYSASDLIFYKRMLRDKIYFIPKKNKRKFCFDLLKLIDKAYEDNYENFDF